MVALAVKLESRTLDEAERSLVVLSIFCDFRLWHPLPDFLLFPFASQAHGLHNLPPFCGLAPRSLTPS